MSTTGLSATAFQLGHSGQARYEHAAGRRVASLLGSERLRHVALGIVAVAIAALDVLLYIPDDAPSYSLPLSTLAVAALLLHRWFPFLTMLATIPGFMVGWSQLAAMIALGLLAYRKGAHWQMWTGAGLVLTCRFVLWPLAEMAELTWGEHLLDLIYGVVVAGMPIALALLIIARKDLRSRLDELDASRDREQQMLARAARADERTRLAREMHDVVSHEVTLIAMQANALEVANTAEDARRVAGTIRALSTRTLEELRSLVGVLRSATDDELTAPGLERIVDLVRETDARVHVKLEAVPDTLPAQVSAAAFRTVQEALTNMHKHAPGASATVRVHLADSMLRVEVRNDRPSGHAQNLPSGGHGLAGLAERALSLEGSFHARATEDGGFEVRADYPVEPPACHETQA